MLIYDLVLSLSLSHVIVIVIVTVTVTVAARVRPPSKLPSSQAKENLETTIPVGMYRGAGYYLGGLCETLTPIRLVCTVSTGAGRVSPVWYVYPVQDKLIRSFSFFRPVAPWSGLVWFGSKELCCMVPVLVLVFAPLRR